MSDTQHNPQANDSELPRFRFSMRTMFLVVAAFAILLGLIAPVYRFMASWKANARLMDETRAMIEALPRPNDVPADQWQYGVDWTSNLVCQVYCIYHESDPDSLQRLNVAIQTRTKGPVDLTTLQWIWDEIEKAPRRSASCATNFRNVRRFNKEPITDDNLPSSGGCAVATTSIWITRTSLTLA